MCSNKTTCKNSPRAGSGTQATMCQTLVHANQQTKSWEDVVSSGSNIFSMAYSPPYVVTYSFSAPSHCFKFHCFPNGNLVQDLGKKSLLK